MAKEKYESAESAYARDFLESLFSRERCTSCRAIGEPIYRRGRCRHCYELLRKLYKIEKKVELVKECNRSVPLQLELELRAAHQAVRNADNEGLAYGDLPNRNLDGIALEYELRYLSKVLVKKDLFFGTANLFDYCLTMPQRRFVLYMLSKISRAHRRRHRSRNAWGQAYRSYLDAVQQER